MAYLGVFGERFENDGASFFVYYCPKCRHRHELPYRGPYREAELSSYTNDPFADEDNLSLRQVTPANKRVLNDGNYSKHKELIEVLMQAGRAIMLCDNCKETHQYRHINYIDRSDNNINFFKYLTVEKEYNRIIVNIHGYGITFFNKKLQCHEYLSRMVIHLKNFRVTLLQPIDKKGKVPARFGEPPRMHNITYGMAHHRSELSFQNNNEFLDNFHEEIIPVLREELPKHIKYFNEDILDAKTTYKRKKSKRTFNWDNAVNEVVPKKRLSEEFEYETTYHSFQGYLQYLFLRIRFHNLDKKLIKSIKSGSNLDADIRKNVLHKIGYHSSKQMKELYRLMKVDKGIVKMAKSIKDIKSLSYWNAIIHQRANLAKIAQSDVRIFKTYAANSIMGRLAFGDTRENATVNAYEFYKEIYKTNLIKSGLKEDRAEMQAETLLVNKIIKEDPTAYTLTDLLESYRSIQKAIADGYEVEEYQIRTDKSFENVHDELASIYRKIRTKNRIIHHEEDVCNMQDEIGSFRFEFAPDTHALIDIGAQMNICVGGYDDRAINKNVNIVHVFEDGNPYACCIELSGDYKSIRQAKIDRNHLPEDKLLLAIVEWVKKNNLIIQTNDLCKYLDKDSEFDKLVHENYKYRYARYDNEDDQQNAI